jgi:predicted phage terminase large subunit-like protein
LLYPVELRAHPFCWRWKYRHAAPPRQPPRLDPLGAPFTRKQLKAGDWTDHIGNHFHPADWPRWRYIPERDSYLLVPQRIIPVRDTWRFVTVDPATDVGDTNDHTAMLVVGVCPDGRLLILDVFRDRIDVGDVIPTLARVCRMWRPVSFAGLEEVAFSRLLTREAAKHPDIPPVRPLKPQGKGKVARAVPTIVKCDRAEVYLPQEQAPWLDDFQTELAAFTGVNDAEDDQVVTLTYAVPAAGTFHVAAGANDYDSWQPFTSGSPLASPYQPFPVPGKMGIVEPWDYTPAMHQAMFGRPQIDFPATELPDRPKWHLLVMLDAKQPNPDNRKYA